MIVLHVYIDDNYIHFMLFSCLSLLDSTTIATATITSNPNPNSSSGGSSSSSSSIYSSSIDINSMIILLAY